MQTWYLPADEMNEATQLNQVAVNNSNIDGKIWTTNVGLSGIHRLDLATGKWETFDAYIGQPKNRRRGIYQVVSNSQNNAWFSDYAGQDIGKILALPDALGLDPRVGFLHDLPEHGRTRDNGRGIAVAPLEHELAGDVHVELAAALQAPLQALRREFVLGLLARGIGSPVDRAERAVEIVDLGLAQAAHPFTRRAGDPVECWGLNRAPEPGFQPVGTGGGRRQRGRDHQATEDQIC